ncbi:hypothetical protein MLD38_035095 [Melastoma candidum]|uniref:Uncharacterized protein n=1 Tax=Melastoma candidum TaxID=119954 RepID=A0ACB9MBR0_9MYRT|nr:hypothetical protein MLD38_035095 [Melastoma candidum]
MPSWDYQTQLQMLQTFLTLKIGHGPMISELLAHDFPNPVAGDVNPPDNLIMERSPPIFHSTMLIPEPVSECFQAPLTDND